MVVQDIPQFENVNYNMPPQKFEQGGEVISDFGLALFLGNIIGFFSSVFVCAPLTYEWEKRKRDRFKKNMTRK